MACRTLLAIAIIGMFCISSMAQNAAASKPIAAKHLSHRVASAKTRSIHAKVKPDKKKKIAHKDSQAKIKMKAEPIREHPFHQAAESIPSNKDKPSAVAADHGAATDSKESIQHDLKVPTPVKTQNQPEAAHKAQANKEIVDVGALPVESASNQAQEGGDSSPDHDSDDHDHDHDDDDHDHDHDDDDDDDHDHHHHDDDDVVGGPAMHDFGIAGGPAADDGSLLPEDFQLSDEDFRVFEEVVKGLGDDFDPSHILTFAVPAQKEFCLYENISDDELAHADVNGDNMATLQGALFISGGSGRDIDFQISSPTANILDNRRLSRESAFTVALEEAGTYEICFANLFSKFSQKVITVAFHFEKPSIPVDHLKTEDLLPIGVASDKIVRQLQGLQKELMFMDHRYQNLHLVQKTMGRRAVWGTLMESCVVLTVAFAQICYIKHIVEKGQPMLGYSGI